MVKAVSAFLAIWLFTASFAAPTPDPEASGGCGGGYGGGCCCCVERCSSVPVHSCIPVKTIHTILSGGDCGGWGSSGCGGWGSCDCGGSCDGWDSSCGCCGSSWGGHGGHHGYHDGCCTIRQIHHVPIVTHVPVKTTISPHGGCGSTYHHGCGNSCGGSCHHGYGSSCHHGCDNSCGGSFHHGCGSSCHHGCGHSCGDCW